jgi:hypothetical protein
VPGERIQSIEFLNDGVWTATVGHSRSGYKTKKVTRKGKRTEVDLRLSDRAVVQAIFAGYPERDPIDGPGAMRLGVGWWWSTWRRTRWG